MTTELSQTKKQTNETEVKNQRPPLLQRQMRQQPTSAFGPKALLFTLTLGLALASGGYSGSTSVGEKAYKRMVIRPFGYSGDGGHKGLIPGHPDSSILPAGIFDGTQYIPYEWSEEEVGAPIYSSEDGWGFNRPASDSSDIVDEFTIQKICRPWPLWMGTNGQHPSNGVATALIEQGNINKLLMLLKGLFGNMGFTKEARAEVDVIVQRMFTAEQRKHGSNFHTLPSWREFRWIGTHNTGSRGQYIQAVEAEIYEEDIRRNHYRTIADMTDNQYFADEGVY